jgi:hypothetical protein
MTRIIAGLGHAEYFWELNVTHAFGFQQNLFPFSNFDAE